MAVPYIFAGQTGPIPLNELDANFATIPEFANTAGNVTNSTQANITTVGTLTALTVSGGITGASISTTTATVTGNITGGNISTALITASGAVISGNVSGSNLSTAGTVTATGNVTGGNIVTSNTVSANILSANTLSVTSVTATGNVTGNIVISNTVISNTVTSTDITATGNITGGNISVDNNITISGNLVVTGNATVNGTTTTINAQTLNITDKDIVVANSVSTSALVDGAGILAGNPTVSSLVYSHANLGWGTANNFNIGGNLNVTGSAFATTPGNATSNTQIATTAFVQNVVVNATGSLGTMSTQDASNVAITGGNINSLAVTSLGSNGFGTRTISNTAPSGGNDGDIWYQVS